MDSITVSAARNEMKNLVERVLKNGERIYLTSHGSKVAAIVPVQDVENMEKDLCKKIEHEVVLYENVRKSYMTREKAFNFAKFASIICTIAACFSLLYRQNKTFEESISKEVQNRLSQSDQISIMLLDLLMKKYGK